ncbi:MAG: cytochrome P450 [Cyanobacteriota bacterium]|nr:cytochrome P450 [Cyanobacteriota bacterium]
MKHPQSSKEPYLWQTLRIVTQPMAYLSSCARNYGDNFRLGVLGVNSPPVVFFSDPKAIEAIFTTKSGKLELGKVTHPFLPLVGAESLIMQDGDRHKRLRQLLMPPLHGDRLHNYGKLISDIAAEEISSWVPDATLSIRDYMSGISLEVILRVVFGIQPGKRYLELKPKIEPFLEYVTSPLNSIQFFWPALQQDLGRWSPWGKFRRMQREIDDLIYAEIASRRLQSEGSDILSLLMSARDSEGQGLSDRQLRDQLITLLLLGHETTASALAWAFYWVHRHPQVLAKLKEELASNSDDPLTVAQLPYLEAVCKEALRVHPIALISQPRVVKESLELEAYQFEPGTVLVPCIYLAHRRPETYPNPLEFKPERFLEGKFSPYEYLPFGGGSRSCIGMALSMFEMKLVLATVISKYELELVDNGEVKPVRRGITFVPSSNFKLKVIDKRGVGQAIALTS